MLDLTKLAQQMQGLSYYLASEASANRHRLDRAQTLLHTAFSQQTQLTEQHQQWRDRLCFTAATPIEPLNLRRAIAAAPAAHTVFATDGSQIAPSHHEIAYCYLINVGRIILHYGQNRLPLLDSVPDVFYRPEDLYRSRQWGIRTDEWMGYQRTVSEAIALAELGESLSPTNPSVPTLACVDGSLIYWFLDPLPTEAREAILPPILEAWDRLRRSRIPLIGYISASRSGEAVNFLRLSACPFDAPDCPSHCNGQSEGAPCNQLDPLRDTAVWGMHLQPGQRSPLWKSSARVLDWYGEQAIYFCYVHMGAEIARVECPAWVAEDPDLLETALSLVMAQVQKGYGYPVALAEAHNQAVVRGGDRTRFFALLEQELIRAGLRNVGTSYKEARKRGSIA